MGSQWQPGSSPELGPRSGHRRPLHSSARLPCPLPGPRLPPKVQSRGLARPGQAAAALADAGPAALVVYLQGCLPPPRVAGPHSSLSPPPAAREYLWAHTGQKHSQKPPPAATRSTPSNQSAQMESAPPRLTSKGLHWSMSMPINPGFSAGFWEGSSKLADATAGKEGKGCVT